MEIRRPNRHRTLKQRTDQHMSDQTRLGQSKTDGFAAWFSRCLLLLCFEAFSCECKGMSPVDPVAFFSTRFSWGPTFAFVNTFVNATKRENTRTLWKPESMKPEEPTECSTHGNIQHMVNFQKIGNHGNFQHQRTKGKGTQPLHMQRFEHTWVTTPLYT